MNGHTGPVLNASGITFLGIRKDICKCVCFCTRPIKSQPSLASRASQNLGLRAPWKPIRSAAAALPNQISLPGGKLN